MCRRGELESAAGDIMGGPGWPRFHIKGILKQVNKPEDGSSGVPDQFAGVQK